MENENTKTMIVKKDGNAWYFALPDFVDLQISPAYFASDDGVKTIDKVYDQLIHRELPAESI